MPRGAPDYGIYQRPAIAEQAMWHDDFEAPILKWNTALTAPGNLPVLSSTYVHKGAQSVYFSNAIGLAAVSGINKAFPLLKSGRIGIEFWLRGTTGDLGTFDVNLDMYDGSNRTRARLSYNTITGTLSIFTAGAWLPVITGIYMSTVHYFFQVFKLVIDIDIDMFVRLVAASRERDLSPYPLEIVAPTGDRVITLYITLNGDFTIATEMYLDDFVLTQNEP